MKRIIGAILVLAVVLSTAAALAFGGGPDDDTLATGQAADNTGEVANPSTSPPAGSSSNGAGNGGVALGGGPDDDNSAISPAADNTGEVANSSNGAGGQPPADPDGGPQGIADDDGGATTVPDVHPAPDNGVLEGSTTGSSQGAIEPVPGRAPITSIDAIDPDVCNVVHNLTACDQPLPGFGHEEADVAGGEELEEELEIDAEPVDPIASTDDLSFDTVLVARARLAELTGADAARIDVLEVEEVVWPDASLGVPQPDALYAQVETPGYLVILSPAEGEPHANDLFEYHTDLNGNVVLAKGTDR